MINMFRIMVGFLISFGIYNPLFSNNISASDSLYYKVKVWGFVKYFSDNKKHIDEDLILLIENKIDIEEFIAKNYFVQKIAIKDKKVAKECCIVEHTWIKNCPIISAENKKELLAMSKNRINNLNYEFKHLNYKENNTYKKISYTSKKDVDYNLSIIGISRLWNYLNYFYPHICELKNWDIVLKNALKIVQKEYNYHKYLAALSFISENTLDGHSHFGSFVKYPYNFYTKTIAIDYKSIDNKLIVTKVLKKEYPLKINDTILKVNNKSLIENENFFVSKELHLNIYPIRFNTNYNVLLIKRDNEILSIKLDSVHYIDKLSLFYAKLYEKDTLDFSKQKTLYIDLNNLSKNEYVYVKNNYNKYDKFVLDLRGYPDSKYTSLISRLFYKNTEKAYGIVRPIRNNPGKFKIKYFKLKEGKVVAKKIYVIVNQYTNSAAETECVILMNNPNVKFVGSYTSSSLGGHYQKLILPGELYFSTSTIGVVPSNGKTLHPNGIPIDFLVPNEKDLENELINLLK